MSSARPLCILCERPTADGAVQAVQLDKEKLQTWLLNICGYEFAEEIEDSDLICYFCIWHVEFLNKNGLDFESDSWWPQDSDYLDDAAFELRKSYFDGKIEQCWVQLEQFDDSEEGNKTEPRSQTEMKRRKCVYCEKSYESGKKLGKHVKNAHKNAIRCENQRCATYFHTIEEKAEHVKNFHEMPKERKIIQCSFCEKEFLGNDKYRQHVRHSHAEYPVKCSFRGCLNYFKTEDEMISHFDSAHKEEDKAKAHECEYCGFRAKKKRDLETHIASRHLPKTIKCEKCDKLFPTTKLLHIHDLQVHRFKICSICDAKVTAHYFSRHLRLQNCHRCKNKFDCLGLIQTHRKTCKKTQFKCAHCAKKFPFHSLLKMHLAMKHNVIARSFECDFCRRKYYQKSELSSHIQKFHSAAKN